MRVFVGDRQDGRPEVFIAHREPSPDISEIIEMLAEVRRISGLISGTEAEAAEAMAALARKKVLIERIEAVEQSPSPVRLVHRGIHSPDGFEWGFSGSGPADLAFSVLATELGEEPPPTVYLRFRDDVIARLRRERFELPAWEVMRWVEANRHLVETEMFFKIAPPRPADVADGPTLAVVTAPEEAPEVAAEVAVEESPAEPPPTPGDDAGPRASALVRACEEAWGSIQSHHPDVPDAVMILGTGVERGRLVKLGHWWAGRWLADGEVRGEVLLAGEALNLKPDEVFEVLLHEAAHGLNAARNIKDTSRAGRYHNDHFRVTAEEVGLDVQPLPPYGMAATSLSEAGKERYTGSIDKLGEAMRIARQMQNGPGRGAGRGQEAEGGQGGPDPERSKGSQAAACGCGRKMRMAPSVLALGPVICGLCDVEFTPGGSIELRVAGEPGVAAGSVRVERAERRGTPGLVADVMGVDEESLGAWYETFGTAEEQPMAASSPSEAEALTRGARALLKADGVLSAFGVEVGGHEFSRGDRVILGRDDTEADLPAGTLGIVEDVDPFAGTIDVDFATAGRRLVTVDDSLSRALRHDYAEVRSIADGVPAEGGPLSTEVLPTEMEVEL